MSHATLSTLHGLAGEPADAVRERLETWSKAEAPRRIWERDHTLWNLSDGTELTNRLGWLEAPDRIAEFEARAEELARTVRADGLRWVVLLGMGGSSLAPEVFQSVLGRAEGAPELVLLDSTHPDAARAALERCPADETLVIVASKSGGTIETMSLFHIFWERAERELEAPGRGFVAITDPDTSLQALAEERDFRAVFLADPNVGGRYSALTPFGLVPAALIGADLGRLRSAAAALAEACGVDRAAVGHPGLELAALIVEMAAAGRDKLTLLTSDLWSAFPIWVEQLVAESLGKEGKGVVPVGEEGGGPEIPWGADRWFAVLRTSNDAALAADAERLRGEGFPVVEWLLDDPYELAAEMYRWEFGVGAAGIGLDLHPFDQPDVQIAKTLANEAMAGEGDSSAGGEFVAASDPGLADRCAEWLADLGANEYLGVHAYVPANSETDRRLEMLRRSLRGRHGVVATSGYGPRFLHSTGQLHKGGPNLGRFVQLFAAPTADLEVPTTDYTLGRLVRAQADGDAGALVGRERRVLRVRLDRASDWDLVESALGGAAS